MTFVSLEQEINWNIKFAHYFFHCEVLVMKTMPDKVNEVLNQVVAIVNFITMRPLKSQIFKLHSAMEAYFVCLLHTGEMVAMQKGFK